MWVVEVGLTLIRRAQQLALGILGGSLIARAAAHRGVRAVVFALVLSRTIVLTIFIMAPIFQGALQGNSSTASLAN